MFTHRDHHESYYQALQRAVSTSGPPGASLGHLGSTQYGIRVCVEPIDPSSPDLDDELDTLIRLALSLEA